jgi:outer membrane protein assembly factor BamB
MKTLRCAGLIVLFASTLHASEWPQFRGPLFNGSSDETDLPISWSESEGIVWTATLPGPSAATPIVYKDHVFVSSSDAEKKSLKAIALDRKTGKKLWEHEIASGVERDRKSNYASPSPATDGEVVVFLYGRGELATYDFAGKELWKKDMAETYGDFAFLWTFATSPLLFDGRLYLQVLQRDKPVDGRGFKNRPNDSYLVALDPKTGKEIWRQVRPSKARAESRESFASPIAYVQGDKKQIVVVGGDCLTGHDPKTGKELWRWGTWNPGRIGHWRHVPSPVIGKDIALVCAPKRDPIYAIQLGKSGTLGDSDIAWESSETRDLSSDVPTPAFAYGDFFVLSDVRKSLARVDPKTGKVKWSLSTPGRSKYEASPTVADGKVYLINFAGEVVVVDAKKGKILNTVKTGPTAEYPVRSSIVVAHGNLFIRTNRKLICVGRS